MATARSPDLGKQDVHFGAAGAWSFGEVLASVVQHRVCEENPVQAGELNGIERNLKPKRRFRHISGEQIVATR